MAASNYLPSIDLRLVQTIEPQVCGVILTLLCLCIDKQGVQDAPIVPKGSQNGDMSMVPMTLTTNGTIEGVVITFNRQTQNVALDTNCLEVLQYPLQV